MGEEEEKKQKMTNKEKLGTEAGGKRTATGEGESQSKQRTMALLTKEMGVPNPVTNCSGKRDA